jgi:hypothetical protein
VSLTSKLKAAARATKDLRHDSPPVTLQDLKRGARIAIEEWLREYAKPSVTDPIGLADDLLQELDP